MKKSKPVKEKPKKKVSEPYFDYHEVIDWIEDKYKINTRGYTPKCGFTEAQIEERKRYGSDRQPYLNFWHYISEDSDIHNGSYFYMNLLGDHYKGKKNGDGDWDGDDEYRPRWVREIQKMIYEEFKDDLDCGEMKCWVSW